MGLFGVKGKEKRDPVRFISGKELILLLESAVNAAAEEINGGYYTLGPEIMF